ncbi:hypothetical protein BDN72DRAFT_846773 [Pluteus cervinus]|uniref:Uncharacterized protein n=1 Tax=Pluteus cervinus TaxID=181527 RepID=A0ACD3AFU2_9AGAR|nr:hypothetical protein BDN72DRAFT_846773 [Pluteus cervinus]
MATKTEIARQYLAACDKGDFDEAYTFVSDDFIFTQGGTAQLSNNYGYPDSGGKELQREFETKLRETHSNLVTTIESITEDGDKVHIKAATQADYHIPATQDAAAQTGSSNYPFTCVITFSGDKIKQSDSITL